MTEESAKFRMSDGSDGEIEANPAVGDDEALIGKGGAGEDFTFSSYVSDEVPVDAEEDFVIPSEVIPLAEADDHQQGQETVPPGSFLQRLRALIWPTRGDYRRKYAQRLQSLDDAVAEHPKIAANYVYRGEAYLKTGDYALAVQDFERALTLADRHFADDRWGLVAQTLRDRAQRGLVIARRRLV